MVLETGSHRPLCWVLQTDEIAAASVRCIPVADVQISITTKVYVKIRNLLQQVAFIRMGDILVQVLSLTLSKKSLQRSPGRLSEYTIRLS